MAFAAKPDNAFLLAELCERVYPDRNRIEKKHRNAVARAAKTILDMAWVDITLCRQFDISSNQIFCEMLGRPSMVRSGGVGGR
jgi:hypothetical protein